ncbi:hypothetical protein B0T11DRAFT_272364 [Plectosphaerella cucumerina]|uniref:Uncharacterized protein n=1 Tax=Plectosphaerella cucumerina TaxID=40658 RepID=A0A8K0TVY1_9PEZI|nr:hypothetical protein B0T11DRAFT_272364 [Plectosphaerella cucumerina]
MNNIDSCQSPCAGPPEISALCPLSPAHRGREGHALHHCKHPSHLVSVSTGPRSLAWKHPSRIKSLSTSVCGVSVPGNWSSASLPSIRWAPRARTGVPTAGTNELWETTCAVQSKAQHGHWMEYAFLLMLFFFFSLPFFVVLPHVTPRDEDSKRHVVWPGRNRLSTTPCLAMRTTVPASEMQCSPIGSCVARSALLLL